MEKKVWNIFFNWLERENYYNFPQNPGQLKKHRKDSLSFSSLEKIFSLGKEISYPEFEVLKFPKELYSLLSFSPQGVTSKYAVSSSWDGKFLIHSHWPPKENAKDYVHLGPESFHIYRKIKDSLKKGDKALDLGCGMGVLTQVLSENFKEVYGIDLSPSAISLAQELNNKNNVSYFLKEVGTKDCFNFAKKEGPFDLVVSNPPLAVPGESSMPHRDGGGLGIEIPKLFSNFAYENLSIDGEFWILVGNPLVNGKWLFYEYLKKETSWKIIEQDIVEPYFNQGQKEKHGYDKMGIEKIDLTIFCLKK